MKDLLTIKEVHALIPAHCNGYAPSLRTVEYLRSRNPGFMKPTRRGGRVFFTRATAEKFFAGINQGKVK